MMEICLFDRGRECIILSNKNCNNCKFRKTTNEFLKAQNEADKILSKKGLKRVKKYCHGQAIMTTEERDI